jgi:hypothetical protein
MTIRIIFATAFFISVTAFAVKVASARESMDRLYLESIYPAHRLTPVQHRGFEDLSPEEKKRIIQNYRKYKKLPQNQRKKLNNNYKKWQQMSPKDRQKLKRNYEKLKRMPSSRRQGLKKGPGRR